MKKINRKSDQCLNCGTRYDPEVNYCPNCGQENTDQYVSTKTLLSEFFNNYLSLDSRFIRTIVPFLFQPGKITNEFLEGKRLKYAHPIRWYLVISLIQFLIFNGYQNASFTGNKNDKIINFNLDNVKFTEAQLDSLRSVPFELKYDSSTNFRTFNEAYEDVLFEQLLLSENYSNEEIYDSLQIESKAFTDRLIYTVAIKSTNSSEGEVNNYILDQIPMIVFFILPVYALLLKLFFYKKGYYIKHLIHSIHIHAFLFVVLSVYWTIGWIFSISPDSGLPICLIITSIFIAFSFRRVYKQRWATIIGKMLLVGFFYTFSALIVLLAGILISMLLM